MGGVTLTAPESLGFLAGSTLSGGIINGYDAVTTQAIKTSFYVGGTFKTPLKCLSVGLAYDYCALGNNTTTDPATGDLVPHNSGYQNAGAAYLLWQATEKLSFNTRADYFSQSDYLASSGMPQKAFALTETVQYELWKNVISRLEVPLGPFAERFRCLRRHCGQSRAKPQKRLPGGRQRDLQVLMASLS